MHLDDERAQRFLHGELSAADRDATDRHLESCETCRRSLEASAREDERILALLRAADHPAPAVDVTKLVARARTRGPVAVVRWQRRAAAAAVAIGLAGVAYAVPSSPVRAWVDRLLGHAPPSTNDSAPVPMAPPDAVVSGLSVTPTEHFVVRFSGVPAKHEVRVTIGTNPEVRIHAIGDGASFRSDTDILTVRPGNDADFEVELPRAAPWIEIFDEDRLLLRKEGDRVLTTAPLDSAGRYRLELSAGTR